MSAPRVPHRLRRCSPGSQATIRSRITFGSRLARSTAARLTPRPRWLRRPRQGNSSLKIVSRISAQLRKFIGVIGFGRKRIPDSKPSLDEVIPPAQLEKKVKDYLRNSQALEDYWRQPITAEQLQAEMQRMAKCTKQPNALREIFEALGNDPFVIAECLVRPVLSERLVTHLYTHGQESLDSWRTGAQNGTPKAMTMASGYYRLPTISDRPDECINDGWTATSSTNAPTGRYLHTAVWTGSEMIIWGGIGNLNTGGTYNPSIDSWTATSTINAPASRWVHTAVWTGSEMIVWGWNWRFGLFEHWRAI